MKIKEFWDTRVEGSPMVWNVLKQACEENEPEKAEALLKTYGLTLNNGVMQQTYDDRGYRYDLPPFVINPAVKYGEVRVVVRSGPGVRKEMISVIFRSAGQSDCSLTLANDENIKKIKEKYIDAMKLQKDVRMFFGGKEIKDDMTLGNCNVANNMVVQAFIKL